MSALVWEIAQAASDEGNRMRQATPRQGTGAGLVRPAPDLATSAGEGIGGGYHDAGSRPECEARFADVDADVPATVGRALTEILHDRLAEAGRLDALFSRDIAQRVARFTLEGGKRRRSQFLWWAMRACAGNVGDAQIDAALRIAAALELIQTCALVHDDVMDGSPRRRGRAALHVDIADQYAWTHHEGSGTGLGAAAAVLAGDLALTWADDLLAQSGLDPATGRIVHALWRSMRTEMVVGQYLDMHSQATASRSASRAIRIACLKSALYSVERPLALGAALAGAEAHKSRALQSAGRCAGLAFQLRDDLLGIFGDPQRTGKTAGEDIRAGKTTYPVALARHYAETTGNRSALGVLDQSLGGGCRLTLTDLARVRDVITATGARTAVENKIDRLVEHSTRHLATADLQVVGLRQLRQLVHRTAGVAPPADAGHVAARTPCEHPPDLPQRDAQRGGGPR